jgi:hypothetical protein
MYTITHIQNRNHTHTHIPIITHITPYIHTHTHTHSHIHILASTYTFTHSHTHTRVVIMEARFQRIPGGPHDDRDQVQEGVHQQENDQRAIGHNGGLHALVAEHTRDTIGLRKHTAVDEYERDGEPPRTQHTLNVGRNAGPQEHVRVSHNDADQGQHTEERTAEEAQSAVSKS